METMREERELKYAMAAISHDIRTPLTGALGYLQLMEDAPEGREAYLPIVRRRLEQLEELLGELFLYTRLLNDPAPMECGPTAALPPLWEALAELCPQLEAAGITPELPTGDLSVWASAPALGRVYRNLIVNALRHGGGGLAISAGEGEIRFSNPLGPGPAPDPARLFDRFYQSSPARGAGGAGLGLSIVRELMERMGGRASARIGEGKLEICLTFSPGPDRNM